MITTILVGVKWLPAYFLLTINIILYFVGVFWAIAGGFGAASTCADAQPGRATFLQVQLVTLIMYPCWVFLPIVVFKINDFFFKPDDADEQGNMLYGSWTHKQYAEEEEEDDD